MKFFSRATSRIETDPSPRHAMGSSSQAVVGVKLGNPCQDRALMLHIMRLFHLQKLHIYNTMSLDSGKAIGDLANKS